MRRLTEEQKELKKIKAEEKREERIRKKEQSKALKRMKREGIRADEWGDYVKTRKRRLKKLGIRVTDVKKNAKGEESWGIDTSGYKRKSGMFSKKKITYSKQKPKKRGRKGRSNWAKLFRGEL